MTSTFLSVTGMKCGDCASRLEHALKQVPGVDDAKVNLTSAKAHVLHEVGAVEVASLLEAVRQAGFDASEV